MKKSLGEGTFAVPLPIWCIGSYNDDLTPNLMTIAWGGICSSNPPSLTISLQKARHTYNNIIKHGVFTVNIPSAKDAKAADYCGIAKYAGIDKNKFTALGLTPVKAEYINAPYVNEFPLVLECKVVHSYEQGIHTMFIAEIVDVKADSSVLDSDDKLNISKIDPIIFTPGTRSYHQVGEYIGQAFNIGLTQ